jgi:hypothetical protein
VRAVNDFLVNALIVAIGVGIGTAFLLPPLLSMRRRALGRIYRRELTHDGATYSVRLRKGEGIWRPGENGRVYGPARGAYTREDRPDGVVYHLALTSKDGSLAHFAGPIAPAHVEGSVEQARFRTLRRRVPLIVLVTFALRLGCVFLGLEVAHVVTDWWDLPGWAGFVSIFVAVAAYLLLSTLLFRGLGPSPRGDRATPGLAERGSCGRGLVAQSPVRVPVPV